MNIEQIISEKNKSEAILSSIDDGLLVFDTRLKATGINPAARRLLDLRFAEGATLHCMDICPTRMFAISSVRPSRRECNPPFPMNSG